MTLQMTPSPVAVAIFEPVVHGGESRSAVMPMFGITPCPVTIITFGLFLLTIEQIARRLLVIPVLGRHGRAGAYGGHRLG